uniref:Uncharacterized protein n=1 Tax=Cacopsylla melanoneura TaxID=428564 RepID=A0A8D8S2R9_9HEMI
MLVNQGKENRVLMEKTMKRINLERKLLILPMMMIFQHLEVEDQVHQEPMSLSTNHLLQNKLKVSLMLILMSLKRKMIRMIKTSYPELRNVTKRTIRKLCTRNHQTIYLIFVMMQLLGNLVRK